MVGHQKKTQVQKTRWFEKVGTTGLGVQHEGLLYSDNTTLVAKL